MDLPPVSSKTFVPPAPPPVPGAFWTRSQPIKPASLPEVDVEIDRSHGIPIARFIDLRTGFVISQTPPEQVLKVIEGLMAEIQRREQADGGR